MLPEIVTASFLTGCLVAFFSVNLVNIAKASRSKRRGKEHAEVKHPISVIVGIAALGTVLYFVEIFLYSFLVFTDQTNILQIMSFQLRFPFEICAQFFGFLLTASGYLLFIWSVIARGRYATSWQMPENHKLVTWGPYHYVRHPSYLGYFLMFFGLFFIWLNLVAILPLVAIPGYVQVTVEEEELLIEQFGDEYRRYQKQTGQFFPKSGKQTGDT